MIKPSLWIYIPCISGGGTERFFTQLASSLSTSYRITFFYSIPNNSVHLYNKQKDCIYVLLPTKSALLSAVYLSILSHIRRPNIILTAQNHCNVYFTLLKSFFFRHSSLVISERAVASLALADNPTLARKFIRHLIPYVYNRADIIITQTNAVKSDLIDKFSVSESLIKVIPNFIDIDHIYSALNSTSHVSLNDFGISKPYIISLGRLVPQKGHKYLISAFHQVSGLIPHNLYICGLGPDLDSLRDLCTSLNISHRVIFLGYVQSPYSLIYHSSLFILPSLYEGMPNALLEAISLDVPVISSNCPSGPYEILGQSYPSLLYNPTDFNSLSRLIIKQLNSPLKVDKSLLSSFSVEYVSMRFSSLLASLLR
tara:strand:- start:8052 stop:9158 length:1107 start_codon:yes stop_codon:yes gene_type:complete